MDGAAQLSLPFSGEKLVTWTNETIEYLWHYVTDFL